MNKLTALIAAALLGLTLGAGNAFAVDVEVVILKCQEKVNLGTAGRDVPPQVYQFQASVGVLQPASCIELPPAQPFVDGGRSCAQCLSDLISAEKCGLQVSPAVVLQPDPNRFEFRSVQEFVLSCAPGLPPGKK